MSEDSKMGLFGSKDDKKEPTPDDAAKQDSPDRYAPYCIDSGSETYDTEALSIMDINDIIGVQTEQVVESTLESEIAALSEIITDSKGETNTAVSNEIPESSSDIKFSEELLTEFSSLSPVQSRIPNSSENIFDEPVTRNVSEGKNVGQGGAGAFSILSKAEDSSSENPADVKPDIGIVDDFIVQAKAETPGSVPVENKSDEAEDVPTPEITCDEKPLVAVIVDEAKDFDNTEPSDKILLAEKDVETDNKAEAENPERKTIDSAMSNVEMYSLGENLGSVGTSLEDNKTVDNEDKLESIKIFSKDVIDDDIVEVKSPNSVVEAKSQNEGAIENSEDERSVDILTNVGCTSKSLQLIGEAYISDDSQETDEKGSKVSTLSSNEVEKQKTKHEQELEAEIISDKMEIEVPINEPQIVVTADNISEGPVVKLSSNEQKSTSSEEKEVSDASMEVLPELKSDCENDSQGLNVESKMQSSLSRCHYHRTGKRNHNPSIWLATCANHPCSVYSSYAYGKNESEEKESLMKFSKEEETSSNIVETSPVNSEIVRQNLDELKNETKKAENVDLPVNQLVEDQVEILTDLELKTLRNVKGKDIPAAEIEPVSENITLPKLEISNFKAVNSVISGTDSNQKEEMMEKLSDSSEIRVSEEVDSRTPVECEIPKTDEEDLPRAETYDTACRSEERDSINELSADIENKQMEIISDKDDLEIKESKGITDSTISVEPEVVLEVNPMQNLAKQGSSLVTESKHENDEDKLQLETIQIRGKDSDTSKKQLEIDDNSKTLIKIDETQCQKLSHTNTECSKPDNTDDIRLKMESEVQSAITIGQVEESSEILVKNSELNADLEATVDKPGYSVSSGKFQIDLIVNDVVVPKNPLEIVRESSIEAKDSQEMESETKTPEDVSKPLEDVSKSLKDGEELEEDNLLPAKLVDENNSKVLTDIYPLDEDLKTSETLGANDVVENASEEIISNLSCEITPVILQPENLLESEVKIDEDIKCEPIEELEKLTVVADEISIDELASSVLKEGVQSLESLNSLEILPDGNLSTSAIISSDELKIPEITAEFSESKTEPASLLEEINNSCFIQDSDPTPSVSHGADFITNVIMSSNNIENIHLPDDIQDMKDEIVATEEFVQGTSEDLLKTSKDLLPKDSVTIDENLAVIHEVCKLEIDERLILSKDIKIDLPLKQEDEKLIESAVLGECDVKINLPTDVLFDADDTEQTDVLCSTSADNVDTSQQSSEISELECAVKFLQESEEQTIDSPLLLSPKIAEDIVEENSEQSKSCLFLPETEVYQETLDLAAELGEINPNPITISEGEVITEAAKLESDSSYVYDKNESEEKESLMKFSEDEESSSNIVETSPVNSEIVRQNLDELKNETKKAENVDLPVNQLVEHRVEILTDFELETLCNVKGEDILAPKIKPVSENITLPKLEISNLKAVNSVISGTDLNRKEEMMEKLSDSSEIRVSEEVDSRTPVECEIPKTDEEDLPRAETYDTACRSEERDSINELSADIENKQMEIISDKDDLEIEESKGITDSTISVEPEVVLEVNPMQNLAKQGSSLATESKHENDEDKLQLETMQIGGEDSDTSKKHLEIDGNSETLIKIDETQCQKLFHTNTECSKPDNTDDIRLKMESEVQSAVTTGQEEESSGILVKNSELDADLETTVHELGCSVSSDKFQIDLSVNDVVVPENPLEIVRESSIGANDSQGMESETKTPEDVSKPLEDVSKSLKDGEELEEDNSLPAKLVDENNSKVLTDIYPLDEDLKTSETLGANNVVENASEEIISNLSCEITPVILQPENLLESEVKINEDIKCEPIEELEKLTVVADEISIDELASSVLKEGVQSLESLNSLEILPDGNLSTPAIISSDELKIPEITAEFSESKIEPASLLEEINNSCFIQDSDPTPSVSHGADFITNVIMSSNNIENIHLPDDIQDMKDEIVATEEFVQGTSEDLLKTSKDLLPKDSVTIDENLAVIHEVCKLEIDERLILSKDIKIDLPLKQEDEKLIESAVLGECDVKINLPTDVLFDADDTEQTDVLCSTSADNVDTSQQSSEISELECAVKFLQESEEQTIDSPLLLSPKIAEDIVEENSEQSKSCLFLPETEVCQETLDLAAELEENNPNSIAISEAEIISEAAKLESERKLKIAEKLNKSSESMVKSDVAEEPRLESSSELLKSLLTTSEIPVWQGKSEDNITLTPERSEHGQIPKLSTSIRKSEKIPKTSILEERLKEPPKIEIPVPEVSPRIMDTPTTPKTSLLIQRDSRTDARTMYQKMLDSPKGERVEPKISDTPRKDLDKHDFENVGSPRIILKIAKSAIADCGEPRSPKSPKIRSAANSPNPEDSPGQKLGKIKLKLSRGGHPSIIPNDNFEESAQRHTEAILSPSHIGMKIKLSKTGDPSIIQPDKYDSSDEIKESKHKFDEVSPKRIESPLGMKIKLSKTGDPSIIQQDTKDSTPKRKDKLDIGQEIPKRTDSPIGMKIKLSKSGDASIIQPDRQETSEDTGYKEKFDIQCEIPKRTDSPIGVKIKLSKSGDTSILSSETCEEFRDASSKSRDKLSSNQDIPKRTDSPLGMKFKLTKSGGASIIQPEKPEALDDFKDKSENVADITKRVESPIGMKIKLLKTGDASIIHPEKQEQAEHKESVSTKYREKSEMQDVQKRTDSPLGMRIKVMKSGEASVLPLPQECQESSSQNNESFETAYEIPKRNESPIGMKIKLSKSGDASIIHPEKQESLDESKDSAGSSRGNLTSSQEGVKVSESPLGMKIKLSKTGDASIIHPAFSPECKDSLSKRIEKFQESPKRTESPLGMKIKLSKTGDASIIEPDKKEKPIFKQKEKLASVQEASHKRKETEFPIEMKIKLSKTGHPTIIANEKQESVTETHSKNKEHSDGGQSTYQRRTDPTSPVKDPQLRIFKSGHSTIIQSSRSEVTIEPIQMTNQQKPESSSDIPSKCNDVTISPVDVKKSKLEAKLSQILPEVTIQPVMSGEPKQIMIDKKSGSISRQQMSVINQEISITQVSPTKPADLSMSGKLKEILRKNATNSPANSDCEIIEHRPELIIVNENSNSSQDIMIIEEVKAPVQEVKVPRKRGRPKRSTLPTGQTLMRQPMPQDPLTLGGMQQPNIAEHRESDRPKRTCRNQKSYAPPKRGRGRGRGKRKMDRADCAIGKIPRLEDPLTEIERSTLSLIAPLQPRIPPEETAQTSELYKALKQSPAERKRMISETLVNQGFPEAHKKLRLEVESDKQLASVQTGERKTIEQTIAESSVDLTTDSKAAMISGMLQLSEPVSGNLNTDKLIGEPKTDIQEGKNIMSEMVTTEHQNWLTPSIKLPETTGKSEAISMVQVMDEETRMSAESNSRSQTPARNISAPVVETVINEESQGSVLSTATTESEKVKVKNRRMEINFDPDEGPFTVDKIAEYEWPLDKKGDTFMLQEQISQYLGVKSFKRKYPDLKRRMVEMEERNYLRENGLVSEAMCDMGLTAICSTEVLDVMCSDFPDQYEEYRKHMREKQAKEHSKKQKELTAAANAERNRIDLAEMAVQSALSWNVNFNKARKESRKYSLDLQSFTIHVPKKQLKVDVEKKPSNYPVALIPGQFTDYYREYTPAELRYYPLNTVLYGPMRPNERKFDSQSEGSQSDSDSDSSSDDSSSSSSEGTQDTEESQSTVDEVEIETAANNKEDNKNLKCKMCLKHLNKHGKAEVLIQCGTCNGNVHPSCIDLTLDMVPHIQGYSWQCTDCKTCVQCHNPADEDKMLFCDMCDRGYHIYCVGLRRVPQGRWHCRECAVCASCGLRQPGGANSDRNSVAQWQHEYKKGERNTRVYVSTLCVPCSKLWRKGRYCPHCSRCHSAQRLDLEPNLVHCGACDKYLHLGCVELRYGTIDRKNYICECCSTPNQQQSRPLMSKSLKS